MHIYLKEDSTTCTFLVNLRKFSEQLFNENIGTTASDLMYVNQYITSNLRCKKVAFTVFTD